MGFKPNMINDVMRLMVAILYAGNMTFSESNRGETCVLDENEASLAVASLLGVSYEKLAASLTSRVLFLKEGNITKELNARQAYKATEALIKSIYGANFDYIVKIINQRIHTEKTEKTRGKDHSAYIGEFCGGLECSCVFIPSAQTDLTQPPREYSMITISFPISPGVLDIFGFETFEINTFEQLCINYTNETLQQHFNKHVFKMEQQEYEREGILWKFISFPDNQDVLDLIDMKRYGILALLDEQCIVEWGSDDKFVQQLYTRCGQHDRFEATPQKQAYRKFSVEHYAGYVEYSTEEWVDKNKDQLPAASVELLQVRSVLRKSSSIWTRAFLILRTNANLPNPSPEFGLRPRWEAPELRPRRRSRGPRFRRDQVRRGKVQGTTSRSPNSHRRHGPALHPLPQAER